VQVQAIKTKKFIPAKSEDIFAVLDEYLEKIEEGSVLAVTSKIVAICEGNYYSADSISKNELIRKTAQLYLPKESKKYDATLTITNNLLISNAGIDESNSDGYYVLWPKEPQKSANEIRKYLSNKFKLKNFGIIITDSITTPLRWGTTGIAIAHSGFMALNDYVGKPDIFGRTLQMTKSNIANGLAAAAVLAMGEGAEQTPMALISDLSSIQFQDRNPSEEELKNLKIDIQDDLYSALLKSVKWERGEN
jgi:putative folate metabolism gamma-glutamate ligase